MLKRNGREGGKALQNNQLFHSPPYPIEASIKRLGANLRTARKRRKITIAQAAEKIGTGVRAVSDAENGKPSTAAAIYIALLWAYDLLGDMKEVGDPQKDTEGVRLSALRERRDLGSLQTRLNNDF
jgi:transcriptional regulator with XRE-family HTH domain